jgi:hypothetical protein
MMLQCSKKACTKKWHLYNSTHAALQHSLEAKPGAVSEVCFYLTGDIKYVDR